MKTRHLYHNLLVALIACCSFTACNNEVATVGTEECTVRVNLSIEEPDGVSRAVQAYDAVDFPGRYYLYNASGDYVTSGNLESNSFTLKDFPVGEEATLVILASPNGNQVDLPTEVNEAYNNATLAYQQGEGNNSTNITKDVYRDIIRIKPQIGINEVKAVLTRQNGALEIRIKNMNIKSATLQLNGTQTMYFNDGTGGKVLSESEVTLTNTMEDLSGKNDIRIRINLLPQEDITTGNTANDPNISTSENKLTITDADGKEKKYDIKSNQGTIPIYPNQITWLTLNGDDGDGEFTVSFSKGDINLEDDDWDGWE